MWFPASKLSEAPKVYLLAPLRRHILYLQAHSCQEISQQSQRVPGSPRRWACISSFTASSVERQTMKPGIFLLRRMFDRIAGRERRDGVLS